MNSDNSDRGDGEPSGAVRSVKERLNGDGCDECGSLSKSNEFNARETRANSQPDDVVSWAFDDSRSSVISTPPCEPMLIR